MGHVLRLRRLPACLLILLVLAGIGLALLMSGAARAEEETGASEVRVLRELPEMRGAYQTTYLLSSGLYRTVFSQAPVHYEDASGDWQPIDLTLKATADGAYETTAAAVSVSFTSAAEGAAVVLEGEGGRVTMDLLGATDESPLVEGAEALYPSVAPEVSVRYEATGDGVKETLTLASLKAPSSFTYALTHPDLELRADENGEWGLYAAEAKLPAYVLGPLTVFDSSKDEGEMPAFCDAAVMKVEPGKGESTVTFSLPEKWLTDPARVYPVMVDPQLFTRNPTDTYISQGYPNTAYGSSTELLCGNVSTVTGTCKTLVKFPQLDNPDNIPTDAHIAGATFSIRQFWQPDTHSDEVKIGRVETSSTNWGDTSTWNSTTLSTDPMVTKTTTVMQQWVDVSCSGVVQGWVRGEYANKGFVLYEGSTAASYARKFRSGEYSGTDYRPNLTVDWDQPAATVSAPAQNSVLRIGDTVLVVVDVQGATDTSQISEIRMGVNRTQYPDDRVHGIMGWFAYNPTTNLSPSWVAVKQGPSSWFAYFDSTSYGSDHMEPKLLDCSINAAHTQANFVFRIKENWGNVQDNDFDTYLQLTAGSLTWDTGWVARDRNVDVLPGPVGAATAATSASAWYQETDANDDGIADNPNCDVPDQGRGEVTLSWQADGLADGYQVFLWDGGEFQPVGRVSGSQATTWTTGDLNFCPKDSEVATVGWPQGANGNPFYRSATPDDPAQETLLQPAAYTYNAGLLAGDGTYLYARPRNCGTTNYWKKIDPADGTVSQLGTTDLKLQPALSAFYYAGRVYSGYATMSGSTATIKGMKTTSSYDQQTITLASLPLERSTGSAITASTHNILLASDGSFIYNVAYTLSTSGGTPVFDGFKIRKYSMSGALVSTTSVPMHSFMLSHVLVDGSHLYLCQWADANGARVLKIAKSDYSVVNEWTHNQGDTQTCAGFYDGQNDKFWLGHLSSNKFYRYDGPGDGRDLRDNPNPIYLATDGASTETATFYRFCVVPYIEGVTFAPGSSPDPIIPVTLDNRTLHVREAPRHTTHDLGEWAGHSLKAVLDEARMELSTTDLQIASWGPTAALSRTYSPASRPGSALYAPGWWFSFQQQLVPYPSSGSLATCSQIDYWDERGESYRFAKSGATWLAPNGLIAALAKVTGGWTLTLKSREVLGFDDAGRLNSVSDRNDNAVQYVWSGALLDRITAANGQEIDLTFDASGQLAQAIYATSDGSRQVDYAGPVGSPAYWRVTDYPGTDCELSVDYTYDASNRLVSVSTPDWDGQESPAAEHFIYGDSSGPDLTVRFPDWSATGKPDARAEIDYDVNGNARVTRYGTIMDVPNTAVHEEYHSNPTGTLAWRHNPSSNNDASGETEIWRHRYSADNQSCEEQNPLGHTTQTFYDTRGNCLRSQNEIGYGTGFEYSDDLAVREVEDSGSVTARGFDSLGNPIWEERSLNQSESARTEWTYADLSIQSAVLHKALVQECKWKTVTERMIQDYSAYAPCGEAGTISYPGVQLSYGGSVLTLERHVSWDALGNNRGETELHATSENPTPSTSSYDVSGRKVLETDACSLETHRLYCPLGYETQSWITEPGNAMKGQWLCGSTDQWGRKLTQVRKLWKPETPEGIPVDQETATYDGLGHWISWTGSVNQTPGKAVFDACGQEVSVWEDGCDPLYSTATAYSSAYDALGQCTSVLEPDWTSPETSTYDEVGYLLSTTSSNSASLNVFDESHDVCITVEEQSGEDVECVISSFDDAHRPIDVFTQSLDQTTVSDYDLLGNLEEQSAVDGASVSETHSNALGWPLRVVTNGSVVDNCFDSSGRITCRQEGGTSDTYTYDVLGRILQEITAGGDTSIYDYDTFGNLIRERHIDLSGWTNDIETTYDSLGESVTTYNARTGVYEEKLSPSLSRVVYPQSVLPGVCVDIEVGSNGLESSREAVVQSSGVQTLIDYCVFRPKPITDSRPSRSLIPRQGDQRFESKPITDSTPSRSLLTGAVESLRGSY